MRQKNSKIHFFIGGQIFTLDGYQTWISNLKSYLCVPPPLDCDGDGFRPAEKNKILIIGFLRNIKVCTLTRYFDWNNFITANPFLEYTYIPTPK